MSSLFLSGLIIKYMYMYVYMYIALYIYYISLRGLIKRSLSITDTPQLRYQ